MAKSDPIQPLQPPPQGGQTLGQLWNQIMIKGYLADEIGAYGTAVQDLGPSMKTQLDNYLAQIQSISDEMNKLAGKMSGASSSDQATYQADITALTTERSKVQTQVSTLQSSMQAVLQQGMSFLQQANSFVQELSQMWSQMSGTMSS